ncbi:TonB-dependent receptor [Hymenobacter metallicola]|uniref:TonB-dependent receptor n=1 Tax=Hymenobacter metallicola TaxID=2563114 RepID=A0A4Z0QD51_9BACT|nr:TonB-dependent receptor [Hymenobacter metallicola]TGE27289.1 TonB-dependent receptor [Hymenobacter metallicola]
MRRLGLLFIFLVINSLAFGQQGVISGKVTDKKTGEGVIGATVLVTGTVQAAPVDVQGNYELKLDPGTYNITMTYIGYKPLTFGGIVVTANGKTTLNGVMEENVTNLKEVTVTGQKQTGTEVAMIQDLKKSEVVVSGMSNDQIVRTLDRDAAEVVKRIPGVTIQNNNFIVIRGLAERYNTVLLNDALTPSAEVDTRSFSFDILPSSVIDRILIFKSGSPELPGEMGGGVVKVYTKNSVLENATSLSVSSWVRGGTTFDNGYMVSNRSKTDWLGFDNGQRQLSDNAPSGLVKTSDASPEQRGELSRNLRSTTWLPRYISAKPDLRASLGLSRRYEIGSAYLSNVTSISYSNTREQYSIQRNRYIKEIDPSTGLPAEQYAFNDERAVTGVRLGIIHNWQVRLNNRNRLEFRNFLNQYATDEVVHRTGRDEDKLRDDFAMHYQSRTIYAGQLQGAHDLGQNEHTTVSWSAGYNYVYRDEPDYSRYRNQQQQLPGVERPWLVNIPNEGNIADASRFFSELHENTVMASGQWERRWAGRDSTRANQYKLRAGFYTEHKARSLANRYFSYVRGTNFENTDLELLPIDRIFAPENLDPIKGFTVDEGTKPQDRYEAENTLYAEYIGIVAPISDKFNISGGLRVEHNNRRLRDGGNGDYRELRTIPLPSFNATFNFNDRSLLRLAGSKTVNRPEFREVAPYRYYDYTTNAIILGDSTLKTATIYNADLRYEFYPSRSELISVGVFYKKFNDAIEQVTYKQTSTQLYMTYQNAASAYDIGAEIEVRKGLIDLTESSFLQHLSFVLNASVIKSRVKLESNATNEGFALSDRPLQGQSPYVVNAGLFYQDTDRKWQVSAQYNVIGQRFTFIGDQTDNYSAIEMPRHVIDLAITKGVGEHLQIKAGIQDLLNQPVRQLYDFNANSKIDSNERGSFGTYRRGTYSTLGLVYNF